MTPYSDIGERVENAEVILTPASSVLPDISSWGMGPVDEDRSPIERMP